MMILSIDLGMDGALVFMSGAHEIIKIWDMPTKEASKGRKRREVNPYLLIDIFKECIEYSELKEEEIHVVFEQLRPMSIGSIAIFSQGGFFFGMQWVCASLDLKFTYIDPNKWKKYFKISKSDGNKHLSKSDLKDLARLKAIELFPEHEGSLIRKMDVDRADAILIGNFAYSILN